MLQIYNILWAIYKYNHVKITKHTGYRFLSPCLSGLCIISKDDSSDNYYKGHGLIPMKFINLHQKRNNGGHYRHQILINRQQFAADHSYGRRRHHVAIYRREKNDERQYQSRRKLRLLKKMHFAYRKNQRQGQNGRI